MPFTIIMKQEERKKSEEERARNRNKFGRKMQLVVPNPTTIVKSYKNKQ